MLTKVLSSIKPLLYVSYLTGILVFEIDTKTFNTSVRRWQKLTIFVLSVIQIIGIFHCTNSDLMNKTSTSFFTTTSKMLLFMNYLGNLICMSTLFWILIKRKEFLKIFIKLGEIDKNLENFGAKIDYKRKQMKLACCYFVFGMIFILIAVSSVVYQVQHNLKISISLTLFDTVKLINTVTLISHFIIVSSNIATRFKLINCCLQNSALELQKIHLEIAECVKIYNLIYGTPLLLMLANAFIWSCICASLAVLSSDFALAIGYIISLLFSISVLIMIIKPTENIVDAKQEAIQILYLKMTKVPENSDKIFHLIMQIRHINVELSCKFLISIGVWCLNLLQLVLCI